MAKPKAQAKGKAAPQEQLQELYVEPPLMYRLFPTLLKGRKPSEKALAKQMEKASKPIEIKPRLPIADLLPQWLVEEVWRRTVSRQFFLVYIVIIAAIGALVLNVWRDTQYQQGQLDAARDEVVAAQANFTQVAPLVDYAVKVRDSAEVGNTQALNQLDNTAILNAFTAAAPNGIALVNISIAYGAGAEASCAAGGGSGNPFGDTTPTEAGIGCVTFDGTATSPESLEAFEATLMRTPGFVSADVLPGQVDEQKRYLFTGSVAVGEDMRIPPSPALTLDVEDLPDTNPMTAPVATAATAAQPAPEAAATEGVTP